MTDRALIILLSVPLVIVFALWLYDLVRWLTTQKESENK